MDCHLDQNELPLRYSMLVKNANIKVKNRSLKLTTTKLLANFGLVTLSLHLALSTFNVNVATAAVVSNGSFQINIDQIDVPIEEQKPTPTPVPQAETPGTLGVTYIPTAFSFSITEPTIDFGVLSPTNPISRTTSLKVSSPGSGFQIYAYENHILLSKMNAGIPDTTCDNGACSEITASLWENNLTYGLGYRCDSITKDACMSGFEREQDFKQFSNKSKREIPQLIMQSDFSKTDQQARITYRVNISGTQAKELYRNSVTYIAVPNF